MTTDHFDRYWVDSLNGDHHEFVYNHDHISLPLPPAITSDSHFEMEVYARFMRHLRHVPNSRMEIKILSAIQFTADIMDHGDALVAKTLVDLGLRAPRKAFPATFLDFVDRCAQRRSWTGSSVPPAQVLELKEHWDVIGENRFLISVPSHFAVYNENFYVRA